MKTVARPSVLGHITNNLIYKRLAPGVLSELHNMIPRDEKGRLKAKLHQGLTENYDHPKLREQIDWYDYDCEIFSRLGNL
jgi:P63C domain